MNKRHSLMRARHGLRCGSMCILATALLLAVSACSRRQDVLTGGPIDGVVIDSATGQPVPDALVLIKWIGHTETVHSNNFPCYHAEFAKTDEQGRYHIPAWRMQTKGRAEWIAYIHQTGPILAVVYKRGYVMPWRWQDNPARVAVEPFQGTIVNRFEYLLGSTYTFLILCEGDARTAIPLHEAAYQEGVEIATTDSERKLADRLLVELEAVQYGTNAAMERADRRDVQRSELAGKEASR
jgi:hypothetical protein